MANHFVLVILFSFSLSASQSKPGARGTGTGPRPRAWGPRPRMQTPTAWTQGKGPKARARGPRHRGAKKIRPPPVEFFSHARGPRHRGAKKIRTPRRIFSHLFSSIILVPAGGIGPVGEAASKNMFPPFAGKRNEKLDEKIIRQILLIIFRQVFLWGRGTLLTGWSV